MSGAHHLVLPVAGGYAPGMRRGYLDEGLARAVQAIVEGRARPEGRRILVSAEGACEAPVGFSATYTQPDWDGRRQLPSAITQLMEGEGRCRLCPACLRARRRLWTARAMVEVRQAPRTWFGTLTLAPDARQRLMASAQVRCHRGGYDLDQCPPHERFREYCREVCRDLTKWSKRVRANSRTQLRLLQVFEKHQSGDPHMHLLVHEAGALPVRKAVLREAWTLGFSQWKLVETGNNRAVYYVCKYLAKDSCARVRASIGYGRTLRPFVIADEVEREPVRPPDWPQINSGLTCRKADASDG